MRHLRTNFLRYPQLLSLVPQPVKALILCYPITEELDKVHNEADAKIAAGEQVKLDPTMIYIKQTVRRNPLHSLFRSYPLSDALGRLETRVAQWRSCMLWQT